MDREQNPSLFDSTFITLGFILRNTHTNQSSSNATHCTSNTHPGKSSHNRTCGNQRTNTRNGERADAREPPQASANYSSGGYTRSRAFGCLRVFLVGKIFCPF